MNDSRFCVSSLGRAMLIFSVSFQRVKLCLNQGETESVKIGRGVRQECCISPILFNLYGQYLVKEALAEVGDFKIERRIINQARCANDNLASIRGKSRSQSQQVLRGHSLIT